MVSIGELTLLTAWGWVGGSEAAGTSSRGEGMLLIVGVLVELYGLDASGVVDCLRLLALLIGVV